jgi:hypothetical protein
VLLEDNNRESDDEPSLHVMEVVMLKLLGIGGEPAVE